MITFRLDIGVDLKHSLDIFIASFETDSSRDYFICGLISCPRRLPKQG